MGKAGKDALREGFDVSSKLEFHGTKVTSDAGLPAWRKLDEALIVDDAAGEVPLRDPQGAIKIGAKVVAHSWYVFFQMAELAIPKKLFRAILERIRRLWPPETVPG